MRDVHDANAVDAPESPDEAVLVHLVAVRALSEQGFDRGEAIGATIEDIVRVLDLRTRTVRRALDRLAAVGMIEEPMPDRYRSIIFDEDGYRASRRR